MVPDAAAAFYTEQQQISALTATTVKRLWARMGADFDPSWAKIRPSMVQVVTAGQLAAATRAVPYVPAVLDETGQDGGDPVGDLNPAAFTGTASDGWDLGTLLDQAPIAAKTAVAGGADTAAALAQAGRFLTMATLTQIADTRREVVAADLGRRPKVTGYVRMLNPPSCSRCAVLAGKWFRYNEGFLRHPRCFPAGVAVSGPTFAAATRRWYEGELVILHMASGKRLPITGNHPVLTDQGWVPANLVREGDDLVGSSLPEGATPLVVPHEQHRPALVEDVWSSRSMAGLRRVPTAPEDFHGDGADGEVDVVFADRFLRNGLLSPTSEPLEHLLLTGGLDPSEHFDAERVADEVLVGLFHAADGGMGGGGLGGSLLGGHPGGAHIVRSGTVADIAARLDEVAADHVAAHFEPFAQPQLAFAVPVGGNESVSVEHDRSARWDAPAGAFSEQNRVGYASRGADLLRRLAGQVSADRVVEVERIRWSGHVYNLTSTEGWFSANGLIVSNCDCIHIPATEDRAGDFRTDPYAYFQSLTEAGQEQVFGRSEARAIRDGGDIFRVVNVQQRGLAAPTSRQARRYGAPTRLTVDDIYRTAGTRSNALRMLQEHGYITGPQTRAGNLRGQVEGFGQFGKAGRARAASTAISTARAAGVRDPLNRYTMTAAERRLYDAKVRLDAAEQRGVWLNSVGQNSTDRVSRPTPVTPGQLAILRRNYSNELERARNARAGSVKTLARLLGIAL